MFDCRPLYGVFLLALVGLGLVLPLSATAQPASTCFARPDSDGLVYNRLQEALDAAVNGDTVRVAGVCDLVETVNGTPQVGYIDQDLTVRGGYTETNWMISDPVANPTMIDAVNAGRGLRVNGAITVRVENLTIANGDGSGLGGAQFDTDGGGAILSTGANLTLSRVRLFDNQILAGNMEEARGGAVASDGGDVTINLSAIHDNTVSGSFSYGGGVMVANGTLTLNQSEVYDNTAVADNFDGSPRAEGGGVYIADDDALLISGSRIADNSSQGPGGGIAAGANATLTMTDTEVAGNIAQRQGGGLYLPRTTSVIGQSRIQSNIVNGSIGTAYGRQGGGGLYTDSSSDVTIRQTLVADNTVNTVGLGGGIAVRCFRCTNVVRVENSTLSGNTAVEGGGGLSSYIEQDFIGSTNSDIVLDHVSVINNNATGGNGHALNQERETAQPGDVFDVNSSFSYRNSLIAGNGGANECRNSATHDTIAQLSGGYNLFIAGAGCTDNGTTDQAVMDEATLFGNVVASALDANNTHPLVNDAGNPAFDAIPDGTNGCDGGVSVDQRGGVRAGGPNSGDAGCDVGAYELNTTVYGLELQPPTAAQSGNPGETVTYTLNLTNTGNSTDSFSFTASGNSWGVTVPVTATLNTGESVDVDVSVTVPVAAMSGDEDLVTITAASTGDATQSGASTLTTTAVDEAIDGLTAANDSPTTLGQTTTFSASVTAGTNVVYDWDFGDGNTAPDAGAAPSHTYAQTGDFTASVTATNTQGSQSAATVATVTNEPPVADAGSDATTDVNQPVTLDGSGSSDPDGHLPLSYGWTQTGGTVVALSDASAVQPTFTSPAGPTILRFSLIVTDSFGLSSLADTVEITVEDAAISGLTAANDSPTTLGQTTTFSASVTAGTNVVYDWDFGDGNTAPDAGPAPSHSYGQAGDFTASVTARNETSQQTATTGVTITNDQPLADAGPDQSVNAGEPAMLDGSGSSDPDGHEPLTFQWTQVAGASVTLSDPAAANPDFTAPFDETPLVFELIVTDSFGLASNPDTVEVTAVGLAVPVPSLDRFGLWLLAGMLALFGLIGMRRRAPPGPVLR